MMDLQCKLCYEVDNGCVNRIPVSNTTWTFRKHFLCLIFKNVLKCTDSSYMYGGHIILPFICCVLFILCLFGAKALYDWMLIPMDWTIRNTLHYNCTPNPCRMQYGSYFLAFKEHYLCQKASQGIMSDISLANAGEYLANNVSISF